jgi:hypothetical protein
MSITYQVGRLLAVDEADPELPSLHDATSAALRESDIDQSTPYGVWTGQDHGSELVAIAYQGDLYSGPPLMTANCHTKARST